MVPPALLPSCRRLLEGEAVHGGNIAFEFRESLLEAWFQHSFTNGWAWVSYFFLVLSLRIYKMGIITSTSKVG